MALFGSETSMDIPSHSCDHCTLALPAPQVPSASTLLCYREPGAAGEGGSVACIHAGRPTARVNQHVQCVIRIRKATMSADDHKTGPRAIEHAITNDPLFERAYVFGDGKPTTACIVVLSVARWRPLAAAMGLDPDTVTSWGSPVVAELTLQIIDSLTGAFPAAARPHAVIVTLAPWSAKNTLLTPMLEPGCAGFEADLGPDIRRVYLAPALAATSFGGIPSPSIQLSI